MPCIKFTLDIKHDSYCLSKCRYRKKAWEVLKSESQKWDSTYGPEALRVLLQSSFEKLEFKREPIIVLVSRQAVALRNLKLPSVNGRQILDMISFWAPRYVPYPSQELASGYSIMSQAEGYSNIIMHIIHRSETDRILTILAPWRNCLEAMLLDACGLPYSYRKGIEKIGKKIVAIVHQRDDEYDIAISNSTVLLFSRTIVVTGNSEDKEEYFSREFIKTLQVYRKEQPSFTIEAIVTNIDNSHFIEVLKQASNLMVATIEPQPLCAATLSYNQMENSNLMPAEAKAFRYGHLAYRQVRLLAMLAVAALINFTLTASFVYYGKARQLKILEDKLRNVPSAVKQLHAAAQKALLSPTLAGSGSAIVVLYELYQLTPSGVYLKAVNYQARSQVIVRGTAESLKQALEFLALFDKSVMYKSAKMNYATKRQAVGSEKVEFEIAGFIK